MFLWARAFREGHLVGDQLYEKAMEKLNKVHKEAYEARYEEGQRDEQGDWIIEGHGTNCFPPQQDSSTQTNLAPQQPSASVRQKTFNYCQL